MSKDKDIIKGNIDEIISEDFLSYAVSVIKERAIPNIEDNLKPVHRRILFSMYKNKLWPTEKHKKSSNTVGTTMLLHPHGDAAIYDSMIRLAQPWKMRYPLIEVQGNVGSITGSPAAASRYTEARLSPFGKLMVEELDKESVKFIPTFDNENEEPFIMPSLFPNILCNGNTGIAVGMSSAIAPHNLKEVVDGLVAYINNPTLTIEELLKLMPGPDFPTGGVVINAEKIAEIYKTGSGTLSLEGKYSIEEKNKQTHIVFTEIPYLTDIENIIANVKKLSVEGGMFEEIENMQNNTGRGGLEIRFILKPKVNTRKVLEELMEYTGLKNSIRYGMTVLKDGSPINTNIFGLMNGYINHRHNVIININTHLREKAKARLHIVEGLLIAIQDIDGVISIAKEGANKQAQREALVKKYGLTEIQANAILDMRISQLSRMDIEALKKEQKDLNSEIILYTEIIENRQKRNSIIIEALIDLKNKYGDARRTILKTQTLEVSIKEPENLVIELYDNNEVAVKNRSQYTEGRKTAVGKKSFTKIPQQIAFFNTANNLLIFDTDGKAMIIYGHRFSEMTGFMQNIDIRIKANVCFMLEVRPEDMQKEYLSIITKQGLIKKTLLSDYNSFKTLSTAIKLKDDDCVLSAAITNDTEFALVAAKNKVNKFPLSSVKSSGKATIGVKSIDEEGIYAAGFGSDNDKFLMYDTDGNGKITLVKDYTDGIRAGKGQVVHDNNIGFNKVFNSNILIVGESLKAIILDIEEISIKSIKSQNTSIYGSKIVKIGF